MTTHRHRALLVLLIVAWGISWPVVKIGVTSVPPFWFGCLRFTIAASCLFAFVAIRGEFVLPPRSDWPLVAVSGGLQMAAFSALTGLALTILPPGRASVLAYSTPIWVVPLASWRLNERVTRRAMLGVGIGVLGAFAITAPSLRAGGREHVLAYLMLMGAAAVWAISIVFVRAHRFSSTPLALAPWQMLFAAALLLPFALVADGTLPSLGLRGAASLAYVGPVATAFSYWAVVETGRHFRASTMSMALLATPSLGILISAVTLGETVGASLIVGAASVGVGIWLATITPDPRKVRTLSVKHGERSDVTAKNQLGRVMPSGRDTP